MHGYDVAGKPAGPGKARKSKSKEFFMNQDDRKRLAVEVLEGIHNDVKKSIHRAVSIMGDSGQAMTEIIVPEINEALADCAKGSVVGFAFAPYNPARSYAYGSRDLAVYFNLSWAQAIEDVYTLAKHDRAKEHIREGDYVFIPIKVPSASYDGVDYEALELESVKMVAVHVSPDKVVFQADEVLFSGPMNQNNKNKGGFKETALAKYLNGAFLESLHSISDYLKENMDGLKVSLPTPHEVFGAGFEETGCNWDEEIRFPYFEKRKNRIKVDRDDDTCWWWLSTAGLATDFCIVGGTGGAYATYASGTYGVSPVFCVA
jgi:hypothetical protein